MGRSHMRRTPSHGSALVVIRQAYLAIAAAFTPTADHRKPLRLPFARRFRRGADTTITGIGRDRTPSISPHRPGDLWVRRITRVHGGRRVIWWDTPRRTLRDS